MAKKGIIVAKFGGTSVSTKESVETISSIVHRESADSFIVVVVSALSGVTDMLLLLQNQEKTSIKPILQKIRDKHARLIYALWKDSSMQKKLLACIDKNLKEVEKDTKRKRKGKALSDRIASYGEIMSSYLISSALISRGISSVAVKATECIITNEHFGRADFLVEETKKKVKKVLVPLIKKGVTPVVTGFIGRTAAGKTTTLGRGGSDYTAAILGLCLNASEVQIWTDVNGIMTADPKVVKTARTVAFVSYEEACELAVLGAKVLHPKAILPAIEKNIPIKILNTHNPANKGTTIMKDIQKSHHITAVVCKRGIKIINIHDPKMLFMYGFLYRIFRLFAEEKISVDFISTSEINISLTIDGNYDTKNLIEALKKIADVEVRTNRATVSVIGKPLGTVPVIPGKMYTFLESKNIDIEMISYGPSKINGTIVVKEEDADKVVRILHEGLLGNTL